MTDIRLALVSSPTSLTGFLDITKLDREVDRSFSV
jgi:hypothetical protein